MSKRSTGKSLRIQCFLRLCYYLVVATCMTQCVRILAERKIMTTLSTDDSPYVVKLVGAFRTTEYFALVMDFVPGGDVFSLLRGVGRLDEPSVRIFGAHLILAVQYLHSKGVIHRKLGANERMIYGLQVK